MQQPMICFAITKNNRNSIILSQMFKKNPKPVGDGDEITESLACWKWFRQTPGGKTQAKNKRVEHWYMYIKTPLKIKIHKTT